MIDLLILSIASAAAYYLIRAACDTADTLADDLGPRTPTHTVWRYVCMHCGLNYRTIRLGYDPVHGAEAISHGLCDSCYAHRYPPIEIDLGESREHVAAALAIASEEAIRNA